MADKAKTNAKPKKSDKTPMDGEAEAVLRVLRGNISGAYVLLKGGAPDGTMEVRKRITAALKHEFSKLEDIGNGTFLTNALAILGLRAAMTAINMLLDEEAFSTPEPMVGDGPLHDLGQNVRYQGKAKAAQKPKSDDVVSAIRKGDLGEAIRKDKSGVLGDLVTSIDKEWNIAESGNVNVDHVFEETMEVLHRFLSIMLHGLDSATAQRIMREASKAAERDAKNPPGKEEVLVQVVLGSTLVSSFCGMMRNKVPA